MRIGAHLGVKDEVELIEGAIAHLRAIGADLIIACDMGSTDGTLDIFEKHRGEEGFVLAHNSDEQRTEIWLQNNVTWCGRRMSIGLSSLMRTSIGYPPRAACAIIPISRLRTFLPSRDTISRWPAAGR
jgi:hypothetical protein